MTFFDFVLLALVLGLAGFALYRMHENKRKGKGCCGQCSSCGAACSHRKFHEKK